MTEAEYRAEIERLAAVIQAQHTVIVAAARATDHSPDPRVQDAHDELLLAAISVDDRAGEILKAVEERGESRERERIVRALDADLRARIGL